jgi:hypothetical protein
MQRQQLRDNLAQSVKGFCNAFIDLCLIVLAAWFKLLTFILRMLPLLLRYLACAVFLCGALYCATAGGLNPMEELSWALFSAVLAVTMLMLIDEWDMSWRMIGAGLVCAVLGYLIRITSPVIQGIAVTSLFGMLEFQFITQEENQDDAESNASIPAHGAPQPVSDAEEQGAELLWPLPDVRNDLLPAHHDDLPYHRSGEQHDPQ